MAPLTDQAVNDNLVKKTRDSIRSATLPTGEPVPMDIRMASNSFVAECDEELKKIEKEIQALKGAFSLDEEALLDLEEDRENIRKMLERVDASNGDPGSTRTWDQFWEDNKPLCDLMRWTNFRRQLGFLLMQLILVTVAVGIGIGLIAASVLPPLGPFLVGAAIVAFCLFNIARMIYGVVNAWEKSNENLAARQLNLGQVIKNENMSMVKDKLARATEAQTETAEALAGANEELEEAQVLEAAVQNEVDPLNERKKVIEDSLSEAEIYLTAAQGELDTLKAAQGGLDQTVSEKTRELEAAQAQLKELHKNSRSSENGKAIATKKHEIKGLKYDLRVATEASEENKRAIDGQKLEVKKQEDLVAEEQKKLVAINMELKEPENRLVAAKDKREQKEKKVGEAQRCYADASEAVKGAQTRVDKLTGKLMSPIAKVSAARAIDPKTGRKPAALDDRSPKYESGYGTGK